MKKNLFYFSKLFLFFNFLFFNFSKAQIIIYQEDFESIPIGAIGSWQSGYFGNLNNNSYPYHIFAVQSACATNLIAGTKSMQVTGLTSATTAVCSYQNINQSTNTNYAPLIFHQINASNYSNITLTYKWKCIGERNIFQNFDYGQLRYSLDGTNWTLITDYIRNGNGNTVTVTDLALPASLSNTTFYIGWNFVADGSTVNSPGLTIDDITIKGTPVVTCNPITATASKYVVCANDATVLTVSSTSVGYNYTWYTDWNNNTHSGTFAGTGPSITVNPTISTLYGVVANKIGCPTGVNAAYDLISISVTPAPTLVVLDPVQAITCSNELRQINVVSGGVIPNEALNENWNPVKNPWTTNAIVASGGNAMDALWYIYASGGIASPDNSNFAMVNSNAVGPYVMESSLVSSPISLLDYNGPINLTFNHYYSTFNTPLWYSTATVEVSEDGKIWTVLKTYTGSDVGGPTTFAAESISLNTYSGKPFLLLRFHYTGRYDDVWAIDDIKIKGSSKLTTITWSPTAGLFTDISRTQYNGGNATTLYASPINTTTYTVLAQTGVGCPASTTVTVERGDKDWSGSNQNWNTGSNWSGGTIPTADHCVIIPSTMKKPIIALGTDAFAKNLTIQAGGALTINGGLTVTDFVKNNATAADVVIASDASLKQITDNPVLPNSGSVTAKRNINLSAARQQYNYIISPLANQSLASIYKDSSGNPVPVPFVLYHSEATNKFYTSTGAYIKGRALAVKEPGTAFTPGVMSATFAGPLTNGAFTFGIVNSDVSNVKQGFNLTGNPYPSNIDLRKLYDINGGNTDPTQVTSPNISSTFYFWDNTGNTIFTQQGSSYLGQSYAIFNVLAGSNGSGTKAGSGTKVPTKNVKVGQGFMTRSLIANYNLNFNNSIRTNDSAVDFFGKGASTVQDDRYWLKMTAPSGITSTIAVVHYPAGNNLFGSEDSRSMGGSDVIYSMAEDEKLAINGRSSLVTTDMIPLGTQHFADGQYVIAIDTVEGIFANGQSIYLKDQQTGIITNLSQGSYTFAALAGESAGRFEIIYQPETVLSTDSTVKENIIVYRDGSDFIVKAESKKITSLDVYDSVGRLIYSVKPNAVKVTVPTDRMLNGVYILKIDQGSKITSKKVIR